MDYEEKIEAILKWADDNHPEFDTSFVLSVQECLDEEMGLPEGMDILTEAQENAIDNIIDRFHIEI